MERQNQDNPGQYGAVLPAKSTAPAAHPPDDVVPLRPRSLVITHWLTALFLLLGVTLVLIRGEVDGRALRAWLLDGHRHFGLLILILFLVRVALRFKLGKLPSEKHTAWPLRVAAAVMHIALYTLILVQPLLGWALNNAEGKPMQFFGLTLPALVASDEDLGDRLQAWHQDAAWLLLGLVTLHVAASLWHHFIVKDGALRRMLPPRRS